MQHWTLIPILLVVAACSSVPEEPQLPAGQEVASVKAAPTAAPDHPQQPRPPAVDPSAPSETVVLFSAGNNQAVIGPEETAQLPIGPIGIKITFPVAVDWYSVKVTDDSPNWNVELRNRVPEANVYLGRLRPSDDARPGRVKINVEALRLDGSPYTTMPLTFFVDVS